jgi:hypothetical protein
MTSLLTDSALFNGVIKDAILSSVVGQGADEVLPAYAKVSIPGVLNYLSAHSTAETSRAVMQLKSQLFGATSSSNSVRPEIPAPLEPLVVPQNVQVAKSHRPESSLESSPVRAAEHWHVVKPGENLFRIMLYYHEASDADGLVMGHVDALKQEGFVRNGSLITGSDNIQPGDRIPIHKMFDMQQFAKTQEREIESLADLTGQTYQQAKQKVETAENSIPINKKTAESFGFEYEHMKNRIVDVAAISSVSEQLLKSIGHNGVDANLLTAIARRESTCNLNVKDGAAGEIGAWQVKPSTAEWLWPQGLDRLFGEFNSDLLRNPVVCATVSGFYVNNLIERSGGDVAVALGKYNRGSSRYNELASQPGFHPLDLQYPRYICGANGFAEQLDNYLDKNHTVRQEVLARSNEIAAQLPHSSRIVLAQSKK